MIGGDRTRLRPTVSSSSQVGCARCCSSVSDADHALWGPVIRRFLAETRRGSERHVGWALPNQVFSFFGVEVFISWCATLM